MARLGRQTQTSLLVGRRQYVHLCEDRETALSIGRRHGRPVALEIDSESMAAAGHSFFRSPGGTWLTESVPSHYIVSGEGPDEK